MPGNAEPTAYCPPSSVMAITEAQPFIAALWAEIEPRATDAGFARLSPLEKRIATIESFAYRVRRGGFAEYFAESESGHARDALSALQQIGAPQTASMLERGMGIFGIDGPPHDRAQRQAQMTVLGEGARRFWSALDALFMRAPEDLEALLSANARSEIDSHCNQQPR